MFFVIIKYNNKKIKEKIKVRISNYRGKISSSQFKNNRCVIFIFKGKKKIIQKG